MARFLGRLALSLLERPYLFSGKANRLLSSSTDYHFNRGIASVSPSKDGRTLNIVLPASDKELVVHGKWLRHNCRCPSCWFKPTSQPTVPLTVLAGDLKLISADIKEDFLHYEIKCPSTDEIHKGYCPVEFLENLSLSPSERRKLREPLIASSLPVSDYKSIMTSDLELHKWLKDINYYGFSLVENIPLVKGEIKKLGYKAGGIQETIYGKTFDVVTSDEPTNRAYTQQDLILHMDLGFYEDMPGLQFLHCMRNDEVVQGGESILVDSYSVVKDMKRDYPKQFDVLTRIPVTFNRIHKNHEGGKDISYSYTTPIISLNREGEIVSIRWCSLIFGPIMMNKEDVEPFYEALTLLNSLFSQSKHKIYHRLQPGQAITFNNRRILHGRNNFEQNGGMRHLEGLYVSLDDFRNCFEVLSQRLGTGDYTKNILNGSWTY